MEINKFNIFARTKRTQNLVDFGIQDWCYFAVKEIKIVTDILRDEESKL